MRQRPKVAVITSDDRYPGGRPIVEKIKNMGLFPWLLRLIYLYLRKPQTPKISIPNTQSDTDAFTVAISNTDFQKLTKNTVTSQTPKMLAFVPENAAPAYWIGDVE